MTKFEREARFQAAWDDAKAAGRLAAKQHEPEPMVVQQHANMLDDASPVVQQWVVPEGVCGFAWVVVRPGTCSFARWLKKMGHARPAYRGGVSHWISEHGQSYERKMEHAEAMGKMLQGRIAEVDPKARISWDGRLD